VHEPPLEWTFSTMTSHGSISLSDRDVENLVTAHYDFVWRFLMRLGVHEADAEDMAQHVFLVLNAHRDAPEPGNERAYLAGVARRVASTYRRSQRRRREAATEPPDAADTAPNPEESASSRRVVAELDAILASALDDAEREAFVLFEIEQFTTIEIAAALGIPVGTVSSRLRRARSKFTEAAREVWSLRTIHMSGESDPSAPEHMLGGLLEAKSNTIVTGHFQRGQRR